MAAMGLWWPPSTQGIRGPLRRRHAMRACHAVTVSQIFPRNSVEQRATGLPRESSCSAGLCIVNIGTDGYCANIWTWFNGTVYIVY